VQYTLVVPHLDKSGSSTDARIKGYLTELATRFGGYSSWIGRGGWLNSEGKLIDEAVTYVGVSSKHSNGHWRYLLSLAQRIRLDLAQDGVYVEAGNAKFRIV
jgi:hypothetical protein